MSESFISGDSRAEKGSESVDYMFIAPHYRKNVRAETYDGVSKYSSELMTAISTNAEGACVGVSDLSSAAAYYADANFGFPLIRWEIFWKQVRLVHTLDWYVPVLPKHIPHVVTVHDLIMLEWRRGLKRWKSFLFQRGLREADHYVAISGSVADALQSGLGVSSEKISVVHHGINPIYLRGSAVCVPEKSIDVLFVSNIAHRKNIDVLLRAVERLLSAGTPISVLIVGRVLEEESGVLDRLQKMQNAGVVQLVSGLSERELANTYAKSRIFVSSSTAEGFGMPVLEAMASGVPLLLSDIPIYRELADGYASYFPPFDDESLAGQLRQLLNDESRREEEGARNRRRGESFSWGRCAEETLSVYSKYL